MNDREKINELQALLSLLDEPDADNFHSICTKIISYGHNAIPFLEEAWESHYQPHIQKRIEQLIHTLQFQQVRQDLKTWNDNGGTDLLEACLIIARYQFPSLNEEDIHYQMAVIRKDIWIELNDNLTALEQIRVFNHIFYNTHGFAGNTTQYHAPQNSFINKVLESKKGNPLSLSIIYMLLAQSLDIPVFGINLPEHFVLAYTGKTLNPDTLEWNKNNVLFYINAFSHGTIFSHKDVEDFLKQLKVEPRSEFFTPCTNKVMITRMLHNLLNAYQKEQATEKIQDIQTLLKIVR